MLYSYGYINDHPNVWTQPLHNICLARNFPLSLGDHSLPLNLLRFSYLQEMRISFGRKTNVAHIALKLVSWGVIKILLKSPQQVKEVSFVEIMKCQTQCRTPAACWSHDLKHVFAHFQTSYTPAIMKLLYILLILHVMTTVWMLVSCRCKHFMFMRVFLAIWFPDWSDSDSEFQYSTFFF